MSHTRRHVLVKLAQPFWLAAAFPLLQGCASSVREVGGLGVPLVPDQGVLPPPSAVIVLPFDLDPRFVIRDSGLKPQLQETMGEDAVAARARLANDVVATISETLVEEIPRRTGLPAIAQAVVGIARPGNIVMRGQIVIADAGNTTMRRIVGFGAGQSEIVANIQVFRAGFDGQLTQVRRYDATTTSGRTPGLGVGLASAATGNVVAAVGGAVAGESMRRKSGLLGDAQKMARNVAAKFADYVKSEQLSKL